MWFAKLKVLGTSVRYGNGVHKGLTIESGLHTLKWWFVPNGKDLLFTPFSHDVIVTLHEKHQMVYMCSFDYNFYFWAFAYLLISFTRVCLNSFGCRKSRTSWLKKLKTIYLSDKPRFHITLGSYLIYTKCLTKKKQKCSQETLDQEFQALRIQSGWAGINSVIKKPKRNY